MSAFGAGQYGYHLSCAMDPYWLQAIEWPSLCIQWLQRLGFQTVAMALRDNAISIDDPRLMAEQKLAVVLGTEGSGLASNTIAACDYTARIPMAHQVDSLNVAAANAVAFWQIRVR